MTTTSLRRRSLLAASVLAPLSGLAAAQEAPLPDRPIQLVVPYPAGGPSDRLARLAAELASVQLGRTITLVNQGGAGGTLGLTTQVLPARPDGHVLGLFTGGMLRVPLLQKTSWHPLEDYTFIASLSRTLGEDMGLVVRADSPFQSFADVKAAALRRPGAISYGSAGIGSGVHLAVEQLAEAAGIRLNHVPFKGSAELLPALRGGHLDLVSDLAGAWEPLVDSGALRVLLTYGERAAPRWARVPTAASLGYKVSVANGIGIVGPRGMNPAVVATLERAFVAAGADPRLQALIRQQYMEPWALGAAGWRSWVAGQFEREKAVLGRLGLLPG